MDTVTNIDTNTTVFGRIYESFAEVRIDTSTVELATSSEACIDNNIVELGRTFG